MTLDSITLNEFRQGLDGETTNLLASSCGPGTYLLRLYRVCKISDGESKSPIFQVFNRHEQVYSGEFNPATRRYWELVYGGKP